MLDSVQKHCCYGTLVDLEKIVVIDSEVIGLSNRRDLIRDAELIFFKQT